MLSENNFYFGLLNASSPSKNLRPPASPNPPKNRRGIFRLPESSMFWIVALRIDPGNQDSFFKKFARTQFGNARDSRRAINRRLSLTFRAAGSFDREDCQEVRRSATRSEHFQYLLLDHLQAKHPKHRALETYYFELSFLFVASPSLIADFLALKVFSLLSNIKI